MKIDHVYCINLPRSTDRRTLMEKEFLRENIDVEFFDACDGGDDGTFGCAQSHINIWRDIVKNGYENALIFEDDINLAHNFKKELELLEEPDAWDVLYLYSFCEIPGRAYNKNFIHGKNLSMAGYIISKRCAERLHLLEYDDMGCPIDLFIAVKLNLKTFLAKNKLVHMNIPQQIKSEIGISVDRLTERWSRVYWLEWIDEHLGIYILLVMFMWLVKFFI